MRTWYPVADRFDVIARHVARTSLHGHELVVWRADDDYVNVWENRCLHRGVRLSIGVNDGAELVCRYHAWRYASRSGGCTYIPAHPADSPARTTNCRTFAAAERYGLVWSTLESGDGDDEPPSLDGLDDPFVLRARPVRAPADVTLTAITDASWRPLGAGPSDGEHDEVAVISTMVPGGVAVTAVAGEVEERVVFFVQPVDAGRCVIRPVRAGTPADANGAWRHHATVLGRLVETIEEAAARTPNATPSVPSGEVPVTLPSSPPRPERIPVRIARRWETAEGIAAFELVAADGETLPASQPGDHIDVHLPGDLVRQYSITNGPGETGFYRIGVKRAPDSTGGSAHLHETAAEGDLLEIAPPRNRFPLRRNVPRTLLIAGGIGITPILAMAQALDRVDLDYALHSFVASEDEVAFREILDRLGPVVHRHVGLDPDATAEALEVLLRDPDPNVQVAACGPPPMLDRIREIAEAAGWPDDAITFEYFQTGEIDRSSTFTVELARSARSIEVPSGQSILDAIRADGVDLASSCERGACGTCAVTVLDGNVEHHDVYLSPAERSAGTTILTCVSRAASGRLVLDL